MNLPPSVLAGAAWTTAIRSRADDIISGHVETTLGEEVFARLAGHRAARLDSRNA